jgi:hypothetical protein
MRRNKDLNKQENTVETGKMLVFEEFTKECPFFACLLLCFFTDKLKKEKHKEHLSPIIKILLGAGRVGQVV